MATLISIDYEDLKNRFLTAARTASTAEKLSRSRHASYLRHTTQQEEVLISIQCYRFVATNRALSAT